MSTSRVRVLALAAACAAGCGERSGYWDLPINSQPSSYGLANGVAVVDDSAHRVVMLTALADQQLAKRSLSIGHHVTDVETSRDGKRLFVLAAGDFPRRTTSDEKPSLTFIDTSTPGAPTVTRYPMTEARANLTVDPVGRWVIAYVGSKPTTSFIQNPNEIVLFDLSSPPGPSNPTYNTIQSFGGAPQRLTFTPEVQLPVGPRRLLLVETQIDVTLIELGSSAPQVTVPLKSRDVAQQVTPAGLVVDPGLPGGASTPPTYARIAVRASNDTNVYTLQLGPSPDGTSDFRPTINLTDVGGLPSDIAFVRTDPSPDGTVLQVAALVPAKSQAVLLEPDTSLTTPVTLQAPYSNLSLVTNVVPGANGTDVALLWSANAGGSGAGVALWSLGATEGKPYRSVEVVGITQPIQAVHDVPPDGHLKVLEMANGGGFFVLDLQKRTASPLNTTIAETVTIAPDGQRMWTFQDTNLASVDFKTLSPTPLVTDLPISAAFDVARDGGRSLVAMHTTGTVGATVFDALNPDTATSRRIPAILLEAP